jgi:ABC-type nickel/cobalt efflux system permease component RcnA
MLNVTRTLRTTSLARTHTHARMHASMHARTHARTRTHAHTHSDTHTHTHAHTHTRVFDVLAGAVVKRYGKAWQVWQLAPDGFSLVLLN